MVNLSTGQEVSAGTLKWWAYKKIKQAFIAKIGGSLQDVLAVRSVGEFGLEQIKKIGQVLLPVMTETLDELHEVFLKGCVNGTLDFEKLSIADIRKLFEMCLEVNPLESFLELEKNSLAGVVVQRVMQEANAPASGTQPSNASLYDPAGS